MKNNSPCAWVEGEVVLSILRYLKILEIPVFLVCKYGDEWGFSTVDRVRHRTPTSALWMTAINMEKIK